jgi:hypothetical protein
MSSFPNLSQTEDMNEIGARVFFLDNLESNIDLT